MLHSVFKDLYDQGVLIFLDTDNYVTNTCDDVDYFANRDKFTQMYTEPIKVGWIWSYAPSLDEVVRTLKEDTCYLIEFGFNSVNEKKALEVGRMLVNSLSKFEFMAQWNERALNEHKISTVITSENLPQSVQDLLEEYELE
ncbi:hypothetical protein DH26_gp055 [Chloriridovirus anopheles1]|uniref:Uncharacterized protein n=1 Tax=Chloriridovirus anopheles1 TaxID=1465751 RepID=W8QF15_9VIRU|nr:hypothetical protein DH26_gp055 [Anopheles minimus iridovirus]AHL67549.1 hypothetical protein AMIV_055 [Anopheles minimus iridovirus]